jgi:hypothetical protein
VGGGGGGGGGDLRFRGRGGGGGEKTGGLIDQGFEKGRQGRKLRLGKT